MKYVFSIVIIVFALSVSAQQSDTLMTYSFNIPPKNKMTGATSVYKVLKQDNSSWIKITSDRNHVAQKKETYLDSALTTLNGLYTSYWANSAIFEQKEFVNGKVVGERKIFYEDGSMALTEVYDAQGKLLSGSYLTPKGKPVTLDKFYKDTRLPGGETRLYSYFEKELRYPPEAKEKGIQGKVYLSFVINEQGEANDIQIVRPANPLLNAEAIRLIRMQPKWIPATLFGHPVTSARINTSINFSHAGDN